MSNPDPENNKTTNLMQRVVGAINEADEQAAIERVVELRQKYPQVEPEALVGMLIKQKCLQAGAVGTVTSSASVIPGVGVFVSMIFGVAADIGMTAKMQAELVLEIAAVYEQTLSETEKRSALIMVSGMSSEANQLLEKAGQEIAHKATERIAQRSAIKAIPIMNIAASAGANILSTYVIGRRANVYFSQGPEAMADWDRSGRAILGVDERQLIDWLAGTTTRSWQLVRDSAATTTGAVIIAGKSAGEVVVQGAELAGDAVGYTAKKAGSGVASGAGKAGDLIAGAGRGLLRGVGLAAGVVAEAGKGVAAGAGKISDIAGHALGREQEEDKDKNRSE